MNPGSETPDPAANGADDVSTPRTKSPTGERNGLKLVLEVLGFVLAISVFIYTWHSDAIDRQNAEEKARLERAEEGYRKLGDSYNELLMVCSENPDVACLEVPGVLAPKMPDFETRQHAIHLRVINHFEQAFYLINKNAPKSVKQDVWPGWDLYFKAYLRRASFCRTWDAVKDQWRAEFRAHMVSLRESLGREACASELERSASGEPAQIPSPPTTP